MWIDLAATAFPELEPEPPATAPAIAGIERRLGVTVPADLRALLLETSCSSSATTAAGDQFAYRAGDPAAGVFVWAHETDERRKVADDLADYLRRILTAAGDDDWYDRPGKA